MSPAEKPPCPLRSPGVEIHGEHEFAQQALERQNERIRLTDAGRRLV